MENIQYRYGEIETLAADIDKTRTVEFVISDNSRDRHGTILGVDGWDLTNFNRNGIVGYQHNVYGGDIFSAPNPDDVIGKGSAFKREGKLIGRVEFEPEEINPLAEKIFQKVKFGTLKATSVGFKPMEEGKFGDKKEAEGEDKETYYYGKRELLEFSIVNIPSNPKALKRDATTNMLMYIQKLLPEKSFSEIKKLSMEEIMDLLDYDVIERGVEKDKKEVEETRKIEEDKEKQKLADEKSAFEIEQEQLKLELYLKQQ